MATKKLHILNFSHDEALASTSKGGGESKAARALSLDLGMLPAYWANKGDLVLVPDGASCLEKKLPRGARGRIVAESELKRALEEWPVDSIEPWGWDGLLVRRLRKLGVSPALLPTEEQIGETRRLSSRETAVHLLPLLRDEVEGSEGQSWFCRSADEAWHIVESLGVALLKKPWSSSGRGLKLAVASSPKTAQDAIARIIARQGAVEVEPLYGKLCDMAMEFEAAADGSVDYVGMSVFYSRGLGQYGGGLVASDKELLGMIPSSVQPALLQAKESLLHHLPEVLDGKYRGPLGVDMMVTDDGEGLKLHPCVEINMRRTMGHVAISLRKLLAEGDMAMFTIRPRESREKGITLLTPEAMATEAIMVRETY